MAQPQSLALVPLVLAVLPLPALARLPPFVDADVVDENNLQGAAPQPLSLLQALQLFLSIDTIGGEVFNTQEGEDPRMISITDGGVYRGDLVVYLPITVLLPTFAFRSRYSQAGKAGGWFDWMGRAFGHARKDDIRGPVDRVLTNEIRYDPQLPEYEGSYGALLSRLDAYFHYLRVHDHSCRARTICQLAQDPAPYAPLAHLILSALRKSESIGRPSSYSPDVFRFFRYYWAAERGVAGEDCGHAYPKCPAALEDIVNMSVLKFWQTVASVVSIKLSDE